MKPTLAEVDLVPREPLPSAVVCVRRLGDERGRGDNGSSMPGMQRRIAATVAGGLRPSRNTVPPEQADVIFEDEAHLLACLARDCRARSGGWWWTSLFGQHP